LESLAVVANGVGRMYDGFSAEERRRRFAFKPTTSDVMNVLLQRLCLSLIGGKTLRAAADSGDVVESVLAALREKLSRHKFEFLNGSAEGDLDELEDKLNRTFRSLISPLPVDVAVDEQMIPRDGSEGGTTFDDHREAIGSEFSLVNWVVFMPRKPTANGVLRYILATSLHHTGHGKISYILGSFTNFNKTVPARDAAKVLLLRLRECTPSRQQVRATVDAAFGGVDFAAEMYLKGVDVTAACSSTSNLVSTLFSGLEKRQYRVMERAIGSGMLTLFVYRDNGDMACVTTLAGRRVATPMAMPPGDVLHLYSGGADFLKNLLMQQGASVDEVQTLPRVELLSKLLRVDVSVVRAIVDPPADPDKPLWDSLMAKTSSELQAMCRDRLLPHGGDKSRLSWRLVDNPRRVEDQTVDGLLAQYLPKAMADTEGTFPFWRAHYKDTFNYIDIVDRKNSDIQYPHKMARPTAAVLWSFFQNAIVNAHALYWARTGEYRNIKDWAVELLKCARQRDFK
jgi:hypothetical protein